MSIHLKPIAQQTIVITGASSGIGLTTASLAAEAGAAVVLVARNEDALAKVADDIRRSGGRAVHVVADVADQAAVERVAEVAADRFGGFDTWVNNAGVGVYCELTDLPLEEHRQIFETNYWGVVHGSRVAVRHLAGRPGGGALINVGSVNSDFAIPLLSAYAASKHAVKGFTDGLRMELLHAGTPVSVTLVKPSGIGTPFPQHARNHLDSEPAVAPPVYAPEVVARAILHAAEHQVRDVVVGGAGRIMAGATTVAPTLMDRLFSWTLPAIQRTGEPSTPTDNLFEPAGDGERYCSRGRGRPFSAYTLVERHPVPALALLAVAGIALASRSSRRS
ncbi:SDR family oxidoreductase [Geminicoccus roseus]|uniref:SDR family oxidoreductase n=1 Tax=Geminicoccus roseus TaxID=404900 RepID=UPI00041B0C95|nr:SDR family oxidoreductase [Geminicoccus roseus]